MRNSLLLATKGSIAGGFLIALIFWVHYQIGWQTILAAWSKISVGAVAIICACIMASHALRVVRVYVAYQKGFDLRFSEVAGVSLLHNTISFILPMRLGEAALPLLSKNQLNIDFRYSTSALVLLRVFDAHVLLMLLLSFGSNAYLGDQAKFLSWFFALTTPLVLGLLIIWLRKQPKFDAVRPLVSSLRTLIMLYSITGATWIIKIAALAALAQQLGSLDFSHAWIGTIIADASALSPITGFANAGTFEAAFSIPLLPLGYSSDLLLSVALNVHILILVTNIAAGALGAALLIFKNSTRQV